MGMLSEKINVVIPKLAGSQRTSMMPIAIYSAEHERLWTGNARKQPQCVQLSEIPKYLVHFYRTTRLNRYTYIYIYWDGQWIHSPYGCLMEGELKKDCEDWLNCGELEWW